MEGEVLIESGGFAVKGFKVITKAGMEVGDVVVFGERLHHVRELVVLNVGSFVGAGCFWIHPLWIVTFEEFVVRRCRQPTGTEKGVIFGAAFACEQILERPYLAGIIADDDAVFWEARGEVGGELFLDDLIGQADLREIAVVERCAADGDQCDDEDEHGVFKEAFKAVGFRRACVQRA